jgi:hypothetical protein
MLLPSKNTPGIHSGYRIPYLESNELLGLRRANAIIRVCNAILNSTIHRGGENQVFISDHNFVFSVANTLNGDSGTSTAYRGEYDSNAYNHTDPLEPAYFVGDIVTVSLDNGVFIPEPGYDNPANARPGTYICVRANTPLTDSFGTGIPVWPQYPHPPIEHRFWELIGGLQHFRGNYQADPHTSNTDLPDIIDRGFGAPEYMQGDIVQIAPNSDFASAAAVPGTYVCVVDQPGPSEFPVHTLTPPLSIGFDYPGRSSWVLLSTWPSITNVCDSTGESSEAYADLQQPEI